MRTGDEKIKNSPFPFAELQPFKYCICSLNTGDRYLRPWIIPVPEITFTTRTDEDECLILASNGLWDVTINEEAGEVAFGSTSACLLPTCCTELTGKKNLLH